MEKKNIILSSIIALGFHGSAIAQEVHPALQKTATKIDTSAEYISMVKLNGDITVLTEYLELIIDTARKNGESIPAGINAKELFRILGLDSLKAAGSSAKKMDNAWINHSYLENGGNSKGIFSILGGMNQDYTVTQMCPAGTDLALQFQLDLRQLAPMLIELANISGKENMSERMDKNIPELNMSPAQLLSKLNVTVNMALDINTAENVRNNPMAPLIDSGVILRIDGLNWLWDMVGNQIIEGIDTSFEKTEVEGNTVFTMSAEMKKGMMGYSPQLIIDDAKDHIWISSKPEFFAKCNSGENNLGSSPEFKATMGQLPNSGNSLMYLSKGMLLTLQSQYNFASENGMFGEEFKKGKQIVDRLMVDITESDKGWAVALSKDNDGVHLASRGPFGLQHINYLSKLSPLINYTGYLNDTQKFIPKNMKKALPEAAE